MDVISIVESAYELQSPLRPWLERIARAIRSELDCGYGAQAVLYEASPLSARVIDAGLDGTPPGMRDWLELAPRLGNPEDAAAIFQRPNRLQSFSELASDRNLMQRISPLLNGRRMKDFRALIATDGREWMLMAGSLSTQWESTTPGERHTHQRVATHLMCAARLRWALMQGQQPAEEAFLSPGGDLLHAEGDAKASSARDRLRYAARSIDRARGRLRRSPMEALALWRGIVDGRWSLVDRFESDGKRTLVAVRNDSPHRDPRALTRRQGRVAHLLALGMSYKEIAYALGSTDSTVADHAAAVMRKLGVSRREALIGLLQSAPVRTSSFQLDGLQVGTASTRADPPRLPGLTNSEQEIARAVTRGLSDREIAMNRGRSARTIANQLRSIFRKVGVRSRTELAAKMAAFASPAPGYEPTARGRETS